MVEAAMTCAKSLADAHAVELFSGGPRPTVAPWQPNFGHVRFSRLMWKFTCKICVRFLCVEFPYFFLKARKPKPQ